MCIFLVDSMPKNPSTIYSAATKADEMHPGIDSLNNIDFLPEISRHELNLTRSNAPISEISNNRMIDINEDINNKSAYFLRDITSDSLKSYVSSEFVMVSQTATSLNTQADIGMR